jgi:hypothetical protein
MSHPVRSARDVLGLTPEQELVAARIALRMLGGAHGQSPAILLEAIGSVLASILEKGELYASDFDEAQRYWDILVCGWVRDRALEIRLERLAREAEAGDRIGTA